MVRPPGIAPRSADYQSAALLLSYERIRNWRRAEVLRPNRSGRSICFRDSVRASADSLSNCPCGRICTCVDPLRRRRPELLGHAEIMDLTAGLSPAMPRPKRGVIYLSLREENGPFTRTCTSISSFARSRPSFWTMKGKKEPNDIRLRQKTNRVSPPAGPTLLRAPAPRDRGRVSA